MELGPVVGRGARADVYAVGQERVVKLYQPGTPASVADHEYTKAAAVAQAGLPVPAVLKRIELVGCPGVVYERIRGPSMGEVVVKAPWQFRRLARQLAELHSVIHRRRLAELPSPDLREELAERIERARSLSPETRTKVITVLRQLPLKSCIRLCHGDFHPENVLLSSRGPVVVDWVGSINAQPVLDVARTVLILRLAPQREDKKRGRAPTGVGEQASGKASLGGRYSFCFAEQRVEVKLNLTCGFP